MPQARPLHLRPGAYDDPPSTEASTPRSRREQLERALQLTSELSRREMSEGRNATRHRTLLSPVGRRRRRSPSTSEEANMASETQEEITGLPRTRRSKRRRLDTEPLPAPRIPIKYGHYGQVEPGRLRLELVSYDGGEHSDSRNPGLYLGAKNVLHHNKSVYCSERPSSSIVLGHADHTPFCLEKLHVVGPEHGFTAPVREGLVYIAMNLSDLHKYLDPPPHARRQGIHSPPYYNRRQPSNIRSAPEERLSLSDALRDPEINAALSQPQREQDYARAADAAHDLAYTGTATHADYYGSDFGFGRTDPEAHCEIPALVSTNSLDSPAHSETEHAPVTVLSSDEDADVGPEEASSQEVIDFRLQRLRQMRRRYEVEAYDRDERWSGLNGLHFANDSSIVSSVPRSMYPPFNPSRNDARTRQLVEEAVEAAPLPPPMASSAEATNAVHEANDDPNVTCARFRIRGGKHKVAIKFEPAISGRFILLKLWAGKTNVDVQSLIAKGYGGCRFFPATELA
ncbi:hypothetical protein BAUCODRAFT_147078 [Baudoinia panamericana UAMH 10762]|uniref:Uncharacterized protein n=1 Tax=Baudoinia panamericana (strain UAMH 10762) TaxID=717646 RepID=M2LR17_BAUPA|nr:uncharacterized protein BAUCODRAFT_147078 [Baudoinia panamericana UAMH 10762]EMC96877.1 hypothetical protein BAUCODRAFT_147078 [Baudoinia panamericana UAMH 10762]